MFGCTTVVLQIGIAKLSLTDGGAMTLIDIPSFPNSLQEAVQFPALANDAVTTLQRFLAVLIVSFYGTKDSHRGFTRENSWCVSFPIFTPPLPVSVS